MDSTTFGELREFHEFLGQKLNNGSAHASPEEVLDEWRALHPESDEFRESVVAIRQALADLANGDEGRPIDEVLAELRTHHQLPSR